MSSVLILFAHPRFESSQIQASLVKQIPDRPEIKLHDLYEAYPDFNIDIQQEQALLESYSTILWQFPFFWYSSPALLKQWIDVVLDFGWAYGPGGTHLMGKKVQCVLSTGGGAHAYTAEGHNKYSIDELLRPFERTAKLCKMEYMPPFVVYGSNRMTPEILEEYSKQYAKHLQSLVEVSQ